MENIVLTEAMINDKNLVIAFDDDLNNVEAIELNREKKITNAILNKSCFIIKADNKAVGFAIFDHRFFEQGWIELIVIEKAHRG